MNSESETDPLRELWQQQPLPLASAEREARVLRAVEAEEARVKAERGAFSHLTWWLLPLLIAPSTILYCLAGEVHWAPWLIQIYLWAFATVVVLNHHLLMKYEREFGATLLGRIERLHARERLHQKWAGILSLGGTVFSVAVISLSQVEFFGVSSQFSTGAGFLVAFLLLVWAGVSFPKYRSKVRQRLADLEAMRRELAG